MISYAAGLSKLHFWRFAVATLAGIIPAMLLLGGALAIYLGFDELKDTWKSDEDTEPSAEGSESQSENVEQYKKEIDDLKEEIETLKKE